MKLYIHRTTLVYLDYGDVIDREKGLMWSKNNDIGLAFGFERGDFDTLATEKRTDLPPGIEFIEGEPIERRCDLNPRGLV